jgi:amidophosphoribosyltransferase
MTSVEFVYLARPDSVIDGISVYRSRENMGRMLAKKIRRILDEQALHDIDVSK